MLVGLGELICEVLTRGVCYIDLIYETRVQRQDGVLSGNSAAFGFLVSNDLGFLSVDSLIFKSNLSALAILF